MGKALGMKAKELREEYEGKIAALDQQVTALQREVDLLTEDKVLDMRGVLRARDARDAA